MDHWELYDLKEDPGEMHNLFRKSGYEEITESLFNQLVGLQILYNDTTAVNVHLN
jgi:hypothetical protein